MDVFVARQPIFDRQLNVYGYELLFRSSLTSTAFDGANPNAATSNVITNSFFGMGIDRITGPKPAFINFPRDLLVNEYASVLPPGRVVIEVLETVTPDGDVLSACWNLKGRGYTIAADDVTSPDSCGPLLKMADIIKVDFLSTDDRQRAALVESCRSPRVKMLAEKVEDQHEFDRACRLGYNLFQGYFFAKPAIITGRAVSGFKLNYLRILREIHRPDLDFRSLEELLKHEVSLSYKLLRYVNSAAFCRRTCIQSIREALVLLGEHELRKWLSLVTIPGLASDKPDELARGALIRARFCESVAGWTGLARRKPDLFLMGMFSLLDAMVGRPLEELLRELRIGDEVRDALLNAAAPGKFAAIYRLVLAYEAADWTRLSEIAGELGIPENGVPEVYIEAVKWSGSIFEVCSEKTQAPAGVSSS